MDPSGAWYWVWDFRNFDQSWHQLGAHLARLGARGVIIKAWDGEWRWSRQWTREIVATLQSFGLAVVPFGYNVGDWHGAAIDNPSGPVHDCTIDLDTASAAWAAEIAGTPPFIVLNPEIEFCRQPDPRTHAERYFDLLRERVGDLQVFTAPVPLDTDHWRGNPLDVYADRSDGTMPQCYAFMWEKPDDLGAIMRAAVQRLGRRAPVYPALDLSDRFGNVPAPPNYLRQATALARLLDCPGISYWRYGLVTAQQEMALIEASRELVPTIPAPLDRHEALDGEIMRIDRAGYRYVLGLKGGSGTADLTRWGGPADVAWTETEKAVIWTADGQRFDAMHHGQLAELLADGGARRG